MSDIKKNGIHIEITPRTILYTLLGIFSAYLLYLIRDVVLQLLIAFIFMSALKPAVDSLEKKGVPRSVAAISALLISLSIIVSFIYYAIPPLIIETKDFIIYASRQIFDLIRQIDGNFTPRDLLPIESLSQNIPNITNLLTGTIVSVFGNMLDLIALFFFTLYFLLGINSLKTTISKFLNETRTKFVLETMGNIEKQLGAWVRGELVLMITIGVISYIGLLLLGIDYALPLAVTAGLLEVVPIIGPIISAIPAFFVAATTSWLSGAAVIALYTIIQQMENNLIVPVIMRRAVGIPPLFVLLSLVIGQRLAGISGAILAVPTVAALVIVFQEIAKYHEKKVI